MRSGGYWTQKTANRVNFWRLLRKEWKDFQKNLSKIIDLRDKLWVAQGIVSICKPQGGNFQLCTKLVAILVELKTVPGNMTEILNIGPHKYESVCTVAQTEQLHGPFRWWSCCNYVNTSTFQNVQLKHNKRSDLLNPNLGTRNYMSIWNILKHHNKGQFEAFSLKGKGKRKAPFTLGFFKSKIETRYIEWFIWKITPPKYQQCVCEDIRKRLV